MAKNTNTPRTMAENHRVGTFFATLLFAIVCFLIAFPLIAGLLGSFRPGSKVVTEGLSLDLTSPLTLDNYKYLFAMFGTSDVQDAIVGSQNYFMWYKNSLVLDDHNSSTDAAGMLLCCIRSDHV